MRAVSLSESTAFSEGSNLWIVKNDPALVWWKKLDVHAKYLLSQNFLKQKKNTAPQLESILSAINLKLPENCQPQSYLLLGSEDHFLNKWILLWNDLAPIDVINLIEKTTLNLKTQSLRFFSDSHLIAELETRPSASSISISYIENT